MEKKPNAKRKSAPKRVLRLPDLGHAKRGSSWSPASCASDDQPAPWAAVRPLAYEASDSGLLCQELAAGIQRVKGARRTHLEGSARSGHPRNSVGMRLAQGRGGEAPGSRYSAARGTLGAGRFDGQGQAHPHCPRSRLGQSRGRRMDQSGRHRGRAGISMCESHRFDLGKRDHGEGRPAHRKGLREARGHSTTRTSRLQALVRPPMPCGGRRT